MVIASTQMLTGEQKAAVPVIVGEGVIVGMVALLEGVGMMPETADVAEQSGLVNVGTPIGGREHSSQQLWWCYFGVVHVVTELGEGRK